MTIPATDTKLITLQQRYSSAPYSFLLITNLRVEANRFLNNETKQPEFTYSSYFTTEFQTRRLKELTKELGKEAVDEQSRIFLQKRITETELVLALIENCQTSNKTALIRELNGQLYDIPSKKLFGECLAYLEQRSAATVTTAQFEDLKKLVAIKPSFRLPYSPSDALFEKSKNDFFTSFPGFQKVVAEVDDSKLSNKYAIELINSALEDIGATKQGWASHSIAYGGNVLVSAHKKQVIIGKYFRPRSSLRLKQVIAHEIYGHVHRFMQAQAAEKPLAQDEEGVAIICEQIIAQHFSYKRMLRYIAVALAWGVDGDESRTFYDVHEILWRAFMIVSGCSEHVARDRAFYEAARAFRGSNCKGGGVITKDAIYLASNLRVWQQMNNDPENYSFKKLLMV